MTSKSSARRTAFDKILRRTADWIVVLPAVLAKHRDTPHSCECFALAALPCSALIRLIVRSARSKSSAMRCVTHARPHCSHKNVEARIQAQRSVLHIHSLCRSSDQPLCKRNQLSLFGIATLSNAVLMSPSIMPLVLCFVS